jgi:hypothetical protein
VTDAELNTLSESAVVLQDELGWTDENGWVVFYEVPYGEYLPFQVYRSGYQTVSDSVLLLQSDNTVSVSLNLLVYNVGFNISDPFGQFLENAQVTLSGYGIQYTDSLGQTIFENVLPAEDILFSISRTGFRDTVNILDVVDKDVSLNMVLAGKISQVIDMPSLQGFFFSPNPASDFVNLRLPYRDWELSVFDVFGRLKFSCLDCLENLVLDVSSWSAGIYFLRYRRSGGKNGQDEKLYIIR